MDRCTSVVNDALLPHMLELQDSGRLAELKAELLASANTRTGATCAGDMGSLSANQFGVRDLALPLVIYLALLALAVLIFVGRLVRTKVWPATREDKKPADEPGGLRTAALTLSTGDEISDETKTLHAKMEQLEATLLAKLEQIEMAGQELHEEKARLGSRRTKKRTKVRRAQGVCDVEPSPPDDLG